MLPVFLLQEVTWLAESRRARGGGARVADTFVKGGRQTELLPLIAYQKMW